MDPKHRLPAIVPFGLATDRLRGLFHLPQEAAIAQADAWHAGTDAAQVSGASRVTTRISLRFPVYRRDGDSLEMDTWSGGIAGIRGRREYRIQRGGEVLVTGRSN